MSTTSFEAVIFDLDGVITDTARYHYQAWKALADELGAPFSEHDNEQLKGVDRMGSLEFLLKRTHNSYTDAEKLALADKKNQHYQRLIQTLSPADLLPGALESLKVLKAAGRKIGLASVSKNAPMIISQLGIAHYFDTVVDAAKLTYSKPHPEIFQKAAMALGVDPVRCLGVEDSIAGLQSIKSAGMMALGIGDRNVLSMADEVIPSLDVFSSSDLAKKAH